MVSTGHGLTKHRQFHDFFMKYLRFPFLIMYEFSLIPSFFSVFPPFIHTNMSIETGGNAVETQKRLQILTKKQ